MKIDFKFLQLRNACESIVLTSSGRFISEIAHPLKALTPIVSKILLFAKETSPKFVQPLKVYLSICHTAAGNVIDVSAVQDEKQPFNSRDNTLQFSKLMLSNGVLENAPAFIVFNDEFSPKYTFFKVEFLNVFSDISLSVEGKVISVKNVFWKAKLPILSNPSGKFISFNEL